jgi:asparagine synthase (glutamine-hydrolysing)
MCRIAGIINFELPPDKETIIRMRDAQQHGGPDDFGLYLDDEFPLAFGFRRLSLLDLSTRGHQPMMDESKKIVLVFNGEIYNFREIRKELEQKSYVFESASDTEVIIKAYLEWGRECFKKFNGMFALALLDKRYNKLILARDHAGIKPLYYSLQKNQLYFASEVRAFKKVKPEWPENNHWKKYFLLFGHLPEPITTLEHVIPLQKGTLLEIELPSLKATSHNFFTLYFNYTIHSQDEAISEVHNVLTRALERHLVSDAPIGLFLSGGLDSSLLTVLSSKVIPENLHTLSIVFENEKYSEKYYQDVIIQKTNARHRSYLVTTNDFKDCLPDIMEAMDQPSSDGINAYFICKYAKEYGLKAAISGLGADELFGGYSSFNREKTVSVLQKIPGFMFQIAGIFPDDRRKRISFLRLKNGMGQYLFNRGFFTPVEVAELLDCSKDEVDKVLWSVQNLLPAFVEKLEPLERVSYLEKNFYMQNQLLKDTDYMSMWHGIEVRVPFLDRELMELTYSIHPDIRYSATQSKYLLIEAFDKDVPEEIWKRTKRGFEFPFEQWMRQVKPDGLTQNAASLLEGLHSGTIHWSRYWSFLLSQLWSKIKSVSEL